MGASQRVRARAEEPMGVAGSAHIRRVRVSLAAAWSRPRRHRRLASSFGERRTRTLASALTYGRSPVPAVELPETDAPPPVCTSIFTGHGDAHDAHPAHRIADKATRDAIIDSGLESGMQEGYDIAEEIAVELAG
jgi:hypothetical protein